MSTPAHPYRPDAIALRETKGDRIGWVFSEPPGPRPSWEPMVGNAGAISARFWLDEDGIHVWQAHTCERGERVVAMLPWPTWQVVQYGQVMPSMSCDGCGFHQHVQINAEFIDQGPVTEALLKARSDPDFDARRAEIASRHNAPDVLDGRSR
jgi:hypothetical protein